MLKQWLVIAAVGTFATVALTMTSGARGVFGTSAPEPLPLYVCDELTAEFAAQGWLSDARPDDYVDRYQLVSDPAGTCRHPDVRAAAGYDDGAAPACYLMRAIGKGEPDVPLACDVEDGAGSTARLDCSGFGVRLSAAAPGDFSLSLADSGAGARTSRGTCSGL